MNSLDSDKNSVALAAVEPQIPSNGLAILRHRYLRRNEHGQEVETPVDLFQRVARHIASVEKAYRQADDWIEDLANRFYRLMASGVFLPNSPTLMNAGRSGGILSACFVLPVEDSIQSIFAAVKNAALIQKAGGGTGFSFSSLRPKDDFVSSSGGKSSGPLAYLRVFSEATDAIQQGAFRRGANMGVLRIDHPDIIDFINIKSDPGVLANFNLSVALATAFMEALARTPDAPHTVTNPRHGQAGPLAKAQGHWTVAEVFDLVVQRAWASGEPGLIFIDRINAASPTPHVGAISATNPCGEQPLLPYESCNLGSLNLHQFVRWGGSKRAFDFEAFVALIPWAVRFLDDVIDANAYPIPELKNAAAANRKIGLGVMGFADLLFALGIPYDSVEALELGGKIMNVINTESHRASQALADERGVFPNWPGSSWEAQGARLRNACTTCVAPTGSVSMIAGCSGGIEPAFGMVFKRHILDGKELIEINPEFERVGRERGFFSEQLLELICERGSIQGIDHIPSDVRRIFVTAHDLDPDWHVRMQAAFQAHCDAGVSKTVNLAIRASMEDVRRVFLRAYELGCKGVTVYRDGCRARQPMTAGSVTQQPQRMNGRAKPMALPDLMSAVRIKQPTPFGNMHIKVVVDTASATEREVFAQLGKGGDVANADLEAICRLISLYLRVNGSLEDIVEQLRGIGSTLSIPTRDGRICSLADGLAHGIEKYRRVVRTHGLEPLLLGQITDTISAAATAPPAARNSIDHQKLNAFRLKCVCGADLVFSEGCVKCCSCGFSQC